MLRARLQLLRLVPNRRYQPAALPAGCTEQVQYCSCIGIPKILFGVATKSTLAVSKLGGTRKRKKKNLGVVLTIHG